MINDLEVAALINDEFHRQQTTLRMIASESEPSDDVLEALSSCFVTKYSEGYTGARYYQGQENVDKLERLCIERAKKAFRLPDDWHVNVQPLSGTPANRAVYEALCNVGDKVVGLGLNSGGHLSHGHKVNFSGKLYDVYRYDLDRETELIDYNELEGFVLQVKPKMMLIGTTAYSRILDWKRLRTIADKAECYFVADVAHVAGLIIGEAYPSPIPYADVVTMTTHKTLCCTRGGMILCKPELAKKIDRAVFPHGQGGGHMNQIAALAVGLKEAQSDEFQNRMKQIVKNARKLASVLKDVYGFRIVTGGTDCHLMVVDVSNKGIDGKTAAEALEKAGIECSFSTVPYDKLKADRGSGIRLGTTILTQWGLNEEHMIQVAAFINKALDNHNDLTVLEQIRLDIKHWLEENF